MAEFQKELLQMAKWKKMALFWQNPLETVCFGQNDFILGKADQTCVY